MQESTYGVSTIQYDYDKYGNITYRKVLNSSGAQTNLETYVYDNNNRLTKSVTTSSSNTTETIIIYFRLSRFLVKPSCDNARGMEMSDIWSVLTATQTNRKRFTFSIFDCRLFTPRFSANGFFLSRFSVCRLPFRS